MSDADGMHVRGELYYQFRFEHWWLAQINDADESSNQWLRRGLSSRDEIHQKDNEYLVANAIQKS